MGTAPAEVARERFANVPIARSWVGSQQCHSGHDHAVQAIAALGCLRIDECLLHRVRLPLNGEALERCDRSSVEFNCRDHTSPRGPVIDQNGTGAALAQSAAVARTVEVKVIAQNLQQLRCAGQCQGVFLPVDGQGNVVLLQWGMTASGSFESGPKAQLTLRG